MNPRERGRLLQAAEGYFRAGNPGLARLTLESLIAADASSSKAFELLGYVHGNEGRLDDAHRCLETACRLPGASPEAWYYLGVSCLKQQRPEPAVRAFDKAIGHNRAFFEALHDRGTAYSQLGQNAAALDSYARALKLKPDAFDLVFNIGKVYDESKDFRNALAYYDRALRLDARVADVWAHRGAVFYDLERYGEAIDDWQRALALDPKIDFLRGFLLHARLRCSDWRDWATERADLLARVGAGENACGPFEMLAFSDDEQVQLRVARAYVATHAAAPSAAPLADPAGEGPVQQSRSRQGRIRIGYFSADFGRHAVAYLSAELFERHDRERFETFGFALKKAAPDDEMRVRLMGAFDHFVEVDDKTDAQIVALARDLGLDIAVDLGGHTKGSRTAVFERRVAPIQVNFLGYPGTMGAGFIDYIVADETTIAEPSRHAYAERVVLLPDSFQPSDSHRAMPETDPPRSAFGLAEGAFVFCCFNNTYKINPDIFACWMRILAAVDGSCLWLLADTPQVQDRLRDEAVRAGVAAERLVFGARLPAREYLGRYRRADLFLDTLPFNAGTTANDALFAGLPVLTRPGHAFAARMASSLLRALDLPELVAGSMAEYEATAIALARQPIELERLRGRLLRNRTTAPLFDMPRYSRHLEAAYLEMVRRWQAGLPPDHIRVPRAQPGTA